jgi:hypothetical protein
MRTHILLFIVIIILVQACTPSPDEVQNPTEPPQSIPTEAAPTEAPQPQLPSMTPQEWIKSRPFQEAPTGQAELALNGFPEGYQPQEVGDQIANLPTSGLEVHITQVTYELPVDGQVYTKDGVTVQISSHQTSEARSEHFDLLVGSDSSLSWEFQQDSDHLVARFYDGSNDGRIWISGPYMVAIWSGLDSSAGDPAQDPMVDAFTELYLHLYPPD